MPAYRNLKPNELTVAWQAVESFHLARDPGAFQRMYFESPRHFHIDSDGSGRAVAITGAWRSMPRLGAIFAFGVSQQKAHAFLDYVLGTLRSEGFTEMVSPLLDFSMRSVFESYGFESYQAVDILQKRGGKVGGGDSPGTVRDFRSGEWPRIEEVDSLAFEPFWRLDKEAFSNMCVDGRCLVAEVEGRIVGYAVGSIEGWAATLSRLAVRPDMQRKGIGGWLVCEALAWFSALGCNTVSVSTQDYNDAAKVLYRKFGFHPTSRKLWVLKYRVGG